MTQDSAIPNPNASLRSTTEVEKLSTDQVLNWLDETMQVLRSAAGRSDYWDQAVEATLQIIGLDIVMALQIREGQWLPVAVGAKNKLVDTTEFEPSQTILSELTQNRQMIRRLPKEYDLRGSLLGVEAVIAAPILDHDQQLIGALYGVRKGTNWADRPEISALEGAMVEVIAGGTATGISREKEQRKALEMRVQFEQFFTPALAQELERNPSLLEATDAQITVLFCDIVGFSAVSSLLGARVSMEWIRSILDVLTETVFQHDGVVVDYIGDEMMSMWGAPIRRTDHASRCCLSAIELLQQRPLIDDRWLKKTGVPIDFRIGIYSGPACVGNIGSQRKFKYGPLGSTVNIASRLQGLAKHFQSGILVGQSTVDLLKDNSTLSIRPLGFARLVNIAEPIAIWEIGDPSNRVFPLIAFGFSQIISDVRSGRLARAIKLANQLCEQFPQDLPSQLLRTKLGKIVAAGDIVWDFQSKSPEEI